MLRYLILALAAWAPFRELGAQSFPCGTDYVQERCWEDSAAWRRHRQLLEDAGHFFSGKNTAPKAPAAGSAARIIPVVFHVVHQNGAENLSDAQLRQALDWLNEAFANGGSFDRGSGTHTGIQFCLARRTPTGQATEGITRTQSPLTELAVETDDPKLKNLVRWTPTNYLNIWIVREACSAALGCGLTAYAYYPSNHGDGLDGIVIEARWLTDAATIAPLVHEAGHYFGLAHTFQGGCANNNCLTDGDYVCDTPPDQSTAGIPCDQISNSCDTDSKSGLTIDLPDMAQNFMDYGAYACHHDFTPGQAARMLFFLDGARKSLLASRGCLPPCPDPPLAALGFTDTTIVAGTVFLFSNKKTSPGAHHWSLDGKPLGNQTTASFQFTKPGVFKISLQVMPLNPDLCEPLLVTGTVRVICDIRARFEVDKRDLNLGTPVQVTNLSAPGLQNSWFVDEAPAGAALTTVVFPMPGAHFIKLVVSNGFCRDSQLIRISVRDTGSVNCQDRVFQEMYPLYEDSSYLSHSHMALLSDSSVLIGANIGKKQDGLTGFPVLGGFRVMFIRKKPDGQPLWTKILGNGQSRCMILALTAAKDGGFYALLAIDGAPGEADTQLVKFSADGVQEWASGIEEDQIDLGSFLLLRVRARILVTPDNGVLLGGEFLETINFARFDAKGALLWSRRFARGVDEQFRSMDLISETEWLLLRNLNGKTIVSRFSENGILVWEKQLQTGLPTQGLQIRVDGNNGFYVAGRASFGGGTPWLAKFDLQGNLIWSKWYRFPNNFGAQSAVFNDLQVSGDALTLVGNYKDQFGCFARLTPNGHLLSFKTYASAAGNLSTILHARRGIFWLAGQIAENQGPFSAEMPRCWLLKTDSQGAAGTCGSEAYALEAADWPVFTDNNPAPLKPSGNMVVREGWNPIPILAAIHPATTLCAPICGELEICDNDQDDDGDGLSDCLDPDCDCAAETCDAKYANVWCFSKNHTLDFSTTPPLQGTAADVSTSAPTAVACDAGGRLLFYSNGNTVYDRYHKPMPLGENLGWGAASECIAIPQPGMAGRYYLIVVNGDSGTEETVWYPIDMRLNGGRGDVVRASTGRFLSFLAITGVAATRDCGLDGYWVIFKDTYSGKLPVYRVDANGFTRAAADNDVGFSGPGFPDYLITLRFSPNGRRVALAHYNGEIGLEIFDFDPQTGALTHPQRIVVPGKKNVLGVEFSPNSRFVYIAAGATADSPAQLIQYDLEAPDLAAGAVVVGSETSVTYYQLQLTPQGEIYVAAEKFPGPPAYGAIIRHPDRAGAGCTFEGGAIKYAAGNWCNLIAGDLVKPNLYIRPQSPDSVCRLDTPLLYRVSAPACGVDSLHWSVEGLSATVSPAGEQALITYHTSGMGRLIVTASTPCGPIGDTLQIWVSPAASRALELGPDRTVCDNGVFTFNAGAGFARYRWSNGQADSVLTTLQPGKYWVDVWDVCGAQQSDTVQVRIAPATRLDVGPDLSPCKNETLLFQRPTVFEKWQWSPPLYVDCDTCRSVSIRAAQPAAYTVVATGANGCISVDTLVLNVRDTQFFQLDTGACRGRPFYLYGQLLPADTMLSVFRPAANGVGCDSLLAMRVRPLETPQRNISISLCPDAVYRFQGVELPPDTTAYFYLPAGTGCDTFAMVVTVSQPPLSLIALPKDTTILIGAAISLNVQAQGEAPFQYTWTPAESLSCDACTDPTASPLSSTLYRVVATDNNRCTAEATVNVQVKDLCVDMIPNAFTPNGDDVNERFYPLTQPCVRRVLRWTVLNRWGQKMFERLDFAPNQPDLGWDGTAQGQAQPMDGYVWFAEFELYNGEKVFKKGGVTLLR